MKPIQRLLLILVACLFIGITIPHMGVAESTSVNQFPEGTIVVPMGTDISIDDDAGTVTIVDCPVDITEGDTFIVYLQDLPIGYVATSISEESGSTIISVTKADYAIYQFVVDEGEIELTPDLYDFEPAENVIVMSARAASLEPADDDGFSYSDGRLQFKISLGESSTIVYLDHLSLSHSFSDGSIGAILNGEVGITSTLRYSEDSGFSKTKEVPMGTMRIHGIGKISFSLKIEEAMELNTNMAMHFSVGITTGQDGQGQVVREFRLADGSAEGRGELTLSLKVTAGIDIVAAYADLYAEVGAKTKYTIKATRDESLDKTVRCDDYRIFAYCTVGAEAKYYNILTHSWQSVLDKKFVDINESNTPLYFGVHYEDGELVSSCHYGMEVRAPEFDKYTSNTGSTIASDNRDRILETDVDLPWDLETEGDYYISHGNLNLNGHTLIVNGDLIQSGGTLTIGSGTLIVHGNYRMQSLTDGTYGDSTGMLNMNGSGGIVNIDGDFILQTSAESHSVNSGTINIRGNIIQINPSSGASSFNSGTSCEFVLTADNSHILRFADGTNNSIGWVTFLNDVTSQGDVKLGKIDANGHRFVINGNFTTFGEVELQDFNPEEIEDIGSLTLSGNRSIQSTTRFEDLILEGYELLVNGDMISTGSVDLNGGTLTITGTLYQQSGKMSINNGKLIIGGNYYITGSGSNFVTEIYKPASAILLMKNSKDEVSISGDFITASENYYYYSTQYNEFSNGVMYIGGNFKQISGYSGNFNASDNHKVVFNGTGHRTITFESSSCHFNVLELSQAIEMYTFSPDNCWITLIQPEAPTFGTPDFMLPTAMQEVEESAFEGIAATIVYVPDTCVSIGAYAFRDTAIVQIRIPADCAIANTAFDGCEAVLIFGTAGSPAETYCATHDNCTFIVEQLD